MKNIHEWRSSLKEVTTAPVTIDSVEPDPTDWEFYHTKIQGKAKQYLNWFVNEIEGKNLSLVRKGFIIQEVMNALGLNISQLVRVTSNIKRAFQKKNALMQQSGQTPPTPATPPGQAGSMSPPAQGSGATWAPNQTRP